MRNKPEVHIVCYNAGLKKNVTLEKGTVAPPVLGGQNAHRREEIQSGFALWATECTAPFAEKLATTVQKKSCLARTE